MPTSWSASAAAAEAATRWGVVVTEGEFVEALGPVMPSEEDPWNEAIDWLGTCARLAPREDDHCAALEDADNDGDDVSQPILQRARVRVLFRIIDCEQQWNIDKEELLALHGGDTEGLFKALEEQCGEYLTLQQFERFFFQMSAAHDDATVQAFLQHLEAAVLSKTDHDRTQMWTTKGAREWVEQLEAWGSRPSTARSAFSEVGATATMARLDRVDARLARHAFERFQPGGSTSLGDLAYGMSLEALASCDAVRHAGQGDASVANLLGQAVEAQHGCSLSDHGGLYNLEVHQIGGAQGSPCGGMRGAAVPGGAAKLDLRYQDPAPEAMPPSSPSEAPLALRKWQDPLWRSVQEALLTHST